MPNLFVMTSPKSTRVLTRRHQTPRGGRVFAQQIRQGRELSLRAARCKCPQDICQDAHDPARAGIKAVSTCLCAIAPSHEHQSGVLGHMAPRSDTTLSLSQGMQEPSNSCLPSQRRFLYHCLCFHPSLCFHLYLTFKCENLSPPSGAVSASLIKR